jgi:hypothetical protein
MSSVYEKVESKLQVMIRAPKEGSHTACSTLFAWGRTSGSAVGIYGVLEPVGRDGSPVRGKLLAFFLAKDPEQSTPPPYRWVMAFRFPPELGEYRLRVTALDGEGGSASAYRDVFRVPNFEEIIIGLPTTGDNITAEAQDFTPTGTETTGLGQVTMTCSGGNVIQAIITDDEHPDWVAVFPPLDPDTYTLNVTDADDVPGPTVTGLRVDP